MCMYMKYKYGNWIDEIPEITESGDYTVNVSESLINDSTTKVRFVYSTNLEQDTVEIIEIKYDTETPIVLIGNDLFQAGHNFSLGDENQRSGGDIQFVLQNSGKFNFLPGDDRRFDDATDV